MYLHIGQHWRRRVIVGGVEYQAPSKLENIKQLEAMKGTPLEYPYRVNSSPTASWGEEVYKIADDGGLTFLTADYDTSD